MYFILSELNKSQNKREDEHRALVAKVYKSPKSVKLLSTSAADAQEDGAGDDAAKEDNPAAKVETAAAVETTAAEISEAGEAGTYPAAAIQDEAPAADNAVEEQAAPEITVDQEVAPDNIEASKEAIKPQEDVKTENDPEETANETTVEEYNTNPEVPNATKEGAEGLETGEVAETETSENAGETVPGMFKV